MRKSILIFLFTLLGVLSARAYDFEVDGIYYYIISGTDQVEVTYASTDSYGYPAGGDYSGSVVIPSTVTYSGKTYAVTSIGSDAFYKCSGLTSVTIPESVTSIGYSAFWDCSGLTSVTIPESVTSIRAHAFEGCTGLTSVHYTGNLVQWCGIKFDYYWIDNDWALYIDNVKVKDLLIPEGVTAIGDWAFYGCSGLTSVTIPESVTSIGYVAFAYCSGLTSVTIPESVTSIGNYAFDGTSISTPLYTNKVFAYMPTDYSGEYEIPSGIQSIVGGAFRNCNDLTMVTIPNSVTSIGDGAFQYCSGLTSVTIPESVTSIGIQAFENCSGLTSVTIPESVTSIEYGAFMGCSGLTSVTIPNNVTYIGEYAFYKCSSLTSVTIPNSVTAIGDWAFYGCSGLTSVTIPNSVTTIRFSAFAYCSGLTSVTIPEGVTSIGSYAFWGCTGLTAVTIPEGMTSIGDKAFAYCIGLMAVTIPEGVTSIGDGAFQYCSGLTSVTIPESVTTIGYDAFYKCTGLTSVEWNAVACQDFEYESSYYGKKPPFYGCENITSITFGNQVEHIPAYLCYELSGLASVVWNAVACRDFSSDNPPFPDGENITSVTFGKQVEHIPAFLCYGLSGLTAITLPGSVDTIGKYAFYGCNKLLSVTSLSKIPPYCASDDDPVFSFYEGTLFVPKGSKKAYQTAQEWYKFSRIEETETTYTVTVQPNDAAMGRVTGSGEYQEGEQAILAAIPNQGYRFVRWDDGSTNNPRIMTVSEDITLTAVFAANESPKTYTVTAQPNDTTMGRVTGGGEYEIDKEITLRAIPNEGYHFVKWDDGVKTNPRTLMVTCDTTITAIFVKDEDETVYYTVTVRPNDATMGTVTGGGKYEEDKRATLAAIPNKGYYFDRWDDGNTDNPRTLTVRKNITLTAIFADPTANENAEADNFRVYVQDRTIYLSEYRGLVQVYNVAGQCVYNGHATAIPVQRSGVYILVSGSQRFKVLVK